MTEILSFSKYLLSTYYGLGIVLGDMVRKMKNTRLYIQEGHILVEELLKHLNITQCGWYCNRDTQSDVETQNRK